MSSDNPAAAERRAAAERLLERYPDLNGEELQALIHYFRREASSLDCALVSSNHTVLGKYRQFCRDHYLSRLRPRQVALVATGIVTVVVLVILYLVYGQTP